MTKTLKVYGFNLNGLYRGVVATTSWARVQSICRNAGIRISLTRLYNYGSISFNQEETDLTMDVPETLFLKKYSPHNSPWERQRAP